MTAGQAPTVGRRPSFEAAVEEAVRLTQLYRTKFGPADAPPYRVRKRRSGRHDMWLIYTPQGRIPRRRA